MYMHNCDVATSFLIQPFHGESYHICLQSLLAQRLFFAAADQNLVKTAVVYSHFAEEDIQRSRHRNSHGIAMISARHGHPQIVILTHGEM